MTEFEQTKILAEQGDAEAQCKLGVMYRYGEGVEQDNAESVRWFTKSAEQGHDSAQSCLDTLTKKWRVKMTEFEQTKQLAEKGHAMAQYDLGFMYFKGQGVKQDYDEALRWFKKSAEQRNINEKDLVDKLTKEMESKND